jgi:ABC-type multidrug transport system ATPase subunit
MSTGTVIEVEGLRKEYRRLRGRKTVALDGLDLSVPVGGVFGFLGPNGAGKTTTIRCLLGLVRPTQGRLSLLGADVRRALPTVIGRVGSIVEAPAMFPRFSGRRNLEILAKIHGEGSAAIDASLERVGLTDRAGDMVRTYSLGMKQRLAIAATLLRDPSLLILDEPANGLDPAGIVEVRELIRSLGAEGRTVFVSSHILSEVQQVADQVAIVAKGKLITSGPVDRVLASGGARGLIVRLADLSAGAKALGNAGFSSTRAGDALQVDAVPERAADVTRALADAGLYLTELRPDEADLETVFLELTKDKGVGD